MRALTSDEALAAGYTGSLKGHINTNFYELVEAIGEPSFDWSTRGDKINYEWAVNYRGQIFYIYDWKAEPRACKDDRNFRFNIGGQVDASAFIHALNLRLELLQLDQDAKVISDKLRANLTEVQESMYMRIFAHTRLRASEIRRELENVL